MDKAPEMLASLETNVNLENLLADSNAVLALDVLGNISYNGHNIARLVAGNSFYQPDLCLVDELLAKDGAEQAVYERRLSAFVESELLSALAPIFNLQKAEYSSAANQELAATIIEHCGIVPRCLIAEKLARLPQESRAELRKLGVRFGRFHVFLYDILKPAPVKILMLLWLLQESAHETQLGEASSAVLSDLARGRTTIVYDSNLPKKLYNLAGYDLWGEYAVRVDIAERLATYIQHALAWREGREPKPLGAYDGSNFVVTSWVLSLLGLSYENSAAILESMGYLRKKIIAPADFTGEVVRLKESTQAVGEQQITAELDNIELWYFPKKTFAPKAQHKTMVKNTKPVKFDRRKNREEKIVDSPFASLAKLRKELISSAKKNNNKI